MLLEAVESMVINAVHWLRLAVETTGALVIALGVAVAVYHFARTFAGRQPESHIEVRRILARYLALEFQLGADTLSTAITLSLDQIGKPGAIEAIRTDLNYFLMREMKEERVGSVFHRTSADAP